MIELEGTDMDVEHINVQHRQRELRNLASELRVGRRRSTPRHGLRRALGRLLVAAGTALLAEPRRRLTAP